jgi:uncharacterized protein YqeY
MSLGYKISEDLKRAMREQDIFLLGTLRMLKSALQNQTIALGHELNDVEVLNIFEKQAKQRRDSIEQYKVGKREDLALVETKELVIIESYLPKKMDDKAIERLVIQTIEEVGANSIVDMGKIMKLVLDKAAGTADGKKVSDIVKEKLV